MKVRLPLILASALAIAACQTVDDSQWLAAGEGVPFNRAEKTCEDQQEFVAEEGAKPAFFVKCMAALGWAPKAGTYWARAAEPRDPG